MPSSATPYRLIFLGDRRIAWEVLKRLGAAPFNDTFDLRCLVSCPTLNPHYATLRGNMDYRFISNRERASAAIETVIREEGITLLLSVQYNWVLPPAVLKAVDYHAFNLHNGKLPEYKGYNSISQAILNGDHTYKSTLHWMSDVVDEGDVAYTGSTPIYGDDTAYHLYIRTINAAVDTNMRLLMDLHGGSPIPRMPIDAQLGHFYGRDSVAHFADITGITDAKRRALLARAAFFPPFNVAYEWVEDTKRPVLPPGFTPEMVAEMGPANAPQYVASA